MNNSDYCKVCSVHNVGPEHFETQKHMSNKSLQQFSENKSQFTNLKNGIVAVSCNAQSSVHTVIDQTQAKIKISAKPGEQVVFQFTLRNESNNDGIFVTIQLMNVHFNFVLENLNLKSGTQYLDPGQKLPKDITVTFSSSFIGQYETPIIFIIRKKATNQSIFVVREMVVYVEQSEAVHDDIVGPYELKQVWAKELYCSPAAIQECNVFRIPKNCKQIYCNDLKVAKDADQAEKELTADIKQILTTGITEDNYIKFFHNILWYEETIIRTNIKKYNMTGIKIVKQQISCGIVYALLVPGLGEKRPSLLVGDKLFIRPHDQNEVMFEAVVKEINENVARIGGLEQLFTYYYTSEAKFDVRFFMSRVSLERMHHAIHNVKTKFQESRIFPQENQQIPAVKPIINFFNPLVEKNPEQHCAVEHMVAGTAGLAPYLLHGPPGTGKTVTIVEAVLQVTNLIHDILTLVHQNPKHRVMVCTDSNMAADHVATLLIRYEHMFSSDCWLLRASSQFRVWETLPDCLAKYSNGTSHETFYNVDIEDFMSHNIVITTLSHAAKFGVRTCKRRLAPHITHLFIDEAAQASEPACLIPVCGLLKPTARLVLAGDPCQLGPVVISRNAATLGLGTSLMERLKKTCPLYSDIRNDPNYIMMLRNNFRSHPEILAIPDRLFYKGQLRALAEEDNLTNIDILGERQHSHAIVFHGVMSKEQKLGKSPSFFNTTECEIVQMYVKRLVSVHNVPMADIGIVTPYIRQVYQIKKSLKDVGCEKVEVGTVEAYQGKEKRIVIISTVRANCNFLDHDAKFQLGFLVDDRRFNVAVTRAKAKVIIIGNPLCLEKDFKWRMYMQRCRELGTYHGFGTIDEDDGTRRTQELYDTIAPMLMELKVSTNEPQKKNLM